MKKFGGTIKNIWRRRLVPFVVVAVLAGCGAICAAVFAPQNSNAGNVSAYVEGFQYTGPQGSGKYAMGFNDTNGQTQMFNLGVNDSKPLFSDEDMIKIVDGISVDYGFIMLGAGEQVTLELTNLSDYYGSNFMEYNYVAQATQSHMVTSGTLLDHAKLTVNNGKLWRSTNSPFTLAGVFTNEGFYSFNIECTIQGERWAQVVSMNFSFYIVDEDNYSGNNRPVLMQGGAPYTQGLNGQFYYKSGSNTPYIDYNENRFDVTVNANDHLGLVDTVSATKRTENGQPYSRVDFKNLGDYSVNARIIYWDSLYRGDDGVKNDFGTVIGRWVDAPYSEHTYSLNIFGAQAYYQNYDTSENTNKQLWFGQTDEQGADISKGTTVTVNTSTAATITASINGYIGALKPVVTNSPPVTLRANVLSYDTYNTANSLPASTAFFNDGQGWQQITYEKDAFYEKAGEYFVVVNYKYSLADLGGAATTYQQVFYFKIINYVDARVEAEGDGGNKSVYYFKDYAARRVELNSAFIVFLHDDGDAEYTTGPYEIDPKIELYLYDWDGVTQKNKWTLAPTNGKISLDFFGGDIQNGIYTFRVWYGNKHMSSMDFTVVVDSELIHLNNDGSKRYAVTGTGDRLELVGAANQNNFAVFGSGEVSIAWGDKTSGVGFQRYANVTHYGFVADPAYVQENVTSKTDITSPYIMSDTPTTARVEVAKTAGGWKIVPTFSQGGVYYIEIVDDAGTAHIFVLIIDDTPMGFAQNPLPDAVSNNANIIKANYVNIAYGERKIVKTDGLGTILTSAGVSGFLNGDGNMVICVSRHEISTDNIDFAVPTAVAHNYNGSSIRLETQNFYYLRSIDALGNVTPYYIWLNKDESRGTVVETGARGDANTIATNASMVLSDGMAKLDYVYFSFLAYGNYNSGRGGYENIVDMITLTYYPLDFDTSSINYPFSNSAEYQERIIYSQTNTASAITGVGNVRYLPINQVSTTGQGLYVVTRYLDYQFHTSGTVTSAMQQDQVRNYFFIVDRNDVVPLGGVPFESNVRLNMGAKTADWHDFGKTIQTNSPVTLALSSLGTKYGASSTMTNINFRYGWTGNVTPSAVYDLENSGLTKYTRKSMPSLNLNVSLEKDGVRVNGYQATDTIAASGKYKLTLTDGSGGVNWIPYGDGSNTVDSNKTVISFELLTDYTQSQWLVNGVALPYNQTSVQMDAGDTLEFRYQNDDADYYAKIMELNFYVDGDREVINGVPPSGDIKYYSFDFTDKVSSGASNFMARLFSDGISNIDRYLAIDNYAPGWNLSDKYSSIQSQDLLYSESNDYDKYVYALNNDFVFEGKTALPTQNSQYDIHDTNYIAYQEVDSELRLITGETVQFNYGTERFSDIIEPRLASTETRFFKIIERDEAGNERIYYVQLRGENYTNKVTASGIVDGNNLILATEQTNITQIFGNGISIGDISAYWVANPCFEWSYTISGAAQKYSFVRLNGSAQTEVTETHMSGNLTRSQFEDWIRKMLTSGAGTTINLEVNDGFGVMSGATLYTQYVYISQVSSVTKLVNVRASRLGVNDLTIELTNRSELAGLFPAISFELHLYAISEDGYMNSIPEKFKFEGSNQSITLYGRGNDEYVIRVVDDFGRVSTVEYHGRNEDYKNVVYSGNSSISGGVRYVGSADGVVFTWNPNVYDLEINDEVVRDAGVNAQGYAVYTVKPSANDTSAWRAVYRYRASRVVAQVEEWRFYNVLPEIEFKTANGDAVDIESGIVVGTVEVTVDRSGYKFDSSISYVRMYGEDLGQVERVAIGKYTQKFTLSKVGLYMITITNEVGAVHIYIFEITDVTNLSYKVMFNDEGEWRELVQSLEGFKYNTVVYGERKIPVYWVNTASIEDIKLYTDSVNKTINEGMYSNTGKVQVVSSTNNNRRLVAVAEGNHNTENWVVYYLENVATTASSANTRMYFAIARSNEDLASVRTNTGSGRTSVQISVPSNQDTSDYSTDYRAYRTISKDGLNVTISPRAAQAVSGVSGVATITNLYYADYYYNDVYCGRLYGDEKYGKSVLTINEEDYGVFRFEIYDWAGNKRMFGNKDYYTIYNFCKPPLLINGETIIDEMVYTDKLELMVMSLTDYPQNTSYMYVRSLRIELDGQAIVPEGDPYNGYWFLSVDDKGNTVKNDYKNFTFYQSGRYRIVCEFNTGTHSGILGTGPNGSVLKTSENTIFVANTNPAIAGYQIMPSFYFSGASNITVSSVKLYGHDVTSKFGSAPLKSLKINTEEKDDEGFYEITFEVAANSVYDKYYITRKIWITSVNPTNSVDNLVWASSKFGASVTGGVTLSFSPKDIYVAANGDAVLTVTRDGEIVAQHLIGLTILLPNEDDDLVPVSIYEVDEVPNLFEEIGVYQINVTATDGTIVFADGFTIKEGFNTMLLIVLVGVGIAVVFGAIMFIRLRTGMRVK